MNRNTLGPVAVGFLGVLLTYTPIEAQQPAVDNPPPEVATTLLDEQSATAVETEGALFTKEQYRIQTIQRRLIAILEERQLGR